MDALYSGPYSGNMEVGIVKYASFGRRMGYDNNAEPLHAAVMKRIGQ